MHASIGYEPEHQELSIKITCCSSIPIRPHTLIEVLNSLNVTALSCWIAQGCKAARSLPSMHYLTKIVIFLR